MNKNKLEKILELYKREVRNNEPLHLDHKWIVSSSELSEKEKEELELLIQDHNDLIKNLNYAGLILSFILKKFIRNKEFIDKVACPPSLSPYAPKKSSFVDEFQYYIKILQEYVSTSRWLAETSPKTLTGILPLYLTAILPDREISEDILVFIGLDCFKEAIKLLDETLDKCVHLICYVGSKWTNSSIDDGGVINNVLQRDKRRYKEAEIGTDVHTDVFILDKFKQQIDNIVGKMWKAQDISNYLYRSFNIEEEDEEDEENIYFKGGDIKEWQWDEDGKWGKYICKKNDKKEAKKTKQNPSSFVRENITKE